MVFLNLCYSADMLYGFMDESGSPGLAKNNNDFFVVSLVLFEKDVVPKISRAIDRLRQRLGLPDYYEFHRKKNSKANREAFQELMENIDFKSITIVMQKRFDIKIDFYKHIARILITELASFPEPPKIKMDINPIFHRQIIAKHQSPAQTSAAHSSTTLLVLVAVGNDILR